MQTRPLFFLLAFFAVSSFRCSTLRRDDGSGGDSVEVAQPHRASCERRELTGVVVFDPHYFTPVRAPHRGTFASSAVTLHQQVEPKTAMGEITWGPNRFAILAPVRGVVVHAGAALGSYIGPDDAPFVLANPDRLAVELSRGPLAVGRPIELHVEGAGAPVDAVIGVQRRDSVLAPIEPTSGVTVGARARAIVSCPDA